MGSWKTIDLATILITVDKIPLQCKHNSKKK